MKCAECLSYNESDAAYCAQCGTRLSIYPSSRGPKVLTLLALLLLATVIGGGAVAFLMSQRPDTGDRPEAASKSGPGGDAKTRAGADEPDRRSAPADLASGRALRLAVRRVSFLGHGGRRIGSTDVIVSGDGWLPIPRRLALAATEWVVTGQSSGRSNIVDGLWRRGEKLGLWRTSDEGARGAPLGTYSDDQPLQLHPLDGGEIVTISQPRAFRDGSFLFFSTAAAPGALVQDGALVGWILADATVEGGWLWPGEVGDGIQSELSVGDFYAWTFAGGREEGFAQALPENESSSRARSIIDAQRRRPKLLEEETPEHLLPGSVVAVLIGDLITIRDRGEPARVAELLSAAAIGEFRDATLLILAVDTWDDAFGEEQAIGLAHQWWPELIVPGSVEESDISSLVLAYYARWLHRLITDRAIDAAWSVYDESRSNYPDDADLHLRGVELFLFDSNWSDAERLLDSRAYSISFNDRVALLRKRIQELKSLEGKIIVRFRPGASQIQTQALLNGRARQNFIVDTGASVTTIPTAMASQLGIRITDTTPRVVVRTAGGNVFAADITLDSVSLGGWEIRDVRVLVHDLPGNETLGLLGINFLGKFRMDLRTDEGILILEPR